MTSRQPFAYVVAIEGANVRLNLLDAHRGQVAAHNDGASPVTEIGGLFAVNGGVQLLVLRVRSLSFAEPREAHRSGVGSSAVEKEPLRHLEATVVGTITRRGDLLVFASDSLVSPALGAEAYPLTTREQACVLGREGLLGPRLTIGYETRSGAELRCGTSELLGRHVAVLGSTGQGKSCFTAAMLQQLVQLAGARIVVFDINGEYADALEPHVPADKRKETTLGGASANYRIPYYALGRQGLSRLLLPSEKTQRPALMFALEALPYVQYFASKDRGAGEVGTTAPVLFDDGRIGDATAAAKFIARLRAKDPTLTRATVWPHMAALGCLIAESHALKPSRVTSGAYERDAFAYGSVAPLLTRAARLLDDAQFKSVVEVAGGKPQGTTLKWPEESTALCDYFFGGPTPPWKVHLVNLRNVAHDLMPMVLGSLLELLAYELFRRGQENTYPTLLVLEEAHHYLRQVVDPGDDGARSALAYERLAKEGRKFGLSLWLSTQRPSEVSPTVLAQCGTWAVFRLSSDQDLKAVAAAGEWLDRQEVARIAGLPRQQALIFGAGVALPTRVRAPTASPPPRSADPDFRRWEAS